MNTATVTIGQGKAIHATHLYITQDGKEILGARCDKTGFARRERGRKVRPSRETVVTCRACLRTES